MLRLPVNMARAFNRARGRHKPGVMNGTEQKYDSHLAAQKLCGQVRDYKFEAITLKLGPDLRYTPDFILLMEDWTIELHETKGTKKNKLTGAQTYYAEGDATVKIRAAAEKFPWFTFKLCWLTAEGWQAKEIV